MYLNEISFRDIDQKFVMIKDMKVFEQFHGAMTVPERCDAVFAYCYIDTEEGMTFECLHPAVYENEEIVPRDTYEIRIIVRSGYYRNNRAELKIIPNGENLLTPYFSEYIKGISEIFYKEDVEQIRDNPKWDPYREPDFPDDIKALIIMNGKSEPAPEWIWIRSLKGYTELITEERAKDMIESGMFKDGTPSLEQLVGSIYTDGRIIGLLLNEPNSDFGVHANNEVIVTPHWHDGEMMPLIVCDETQLTSINKKGRKTKS